MSSWKESWKSIAPIIRKKAQQELGNSCLVLFNHPTYLKSADQQHHYYPNTDFLRLTGVKQPDTVLVMDQNQALLFLPNRDPVKEHWEGKMLSSEEIEALGLVPMNRTGLREYLLKNWRKYRTMYLQLGMRPEVDQEIMSIYRDSCTPRSRGSSQIPHIADPAEILSPLRFDKKIPQEISLIKKACEIGAQSFSALEKNLSSMKNERDIQGFLINEFMRNGASGESFATIAASGVHSTTLHYEDNDAPLTGKGHVLVDSGCTYHFYHSDITRTYSLTGGFEGLQKSIYDLVKSVNEKTGAFLKPGVLWKDVHEKAKRDLMLGLIDLKIIKASSDEAWEKDMIRTYFTHGIGHPLGLDVHDVAPPMSAANPSFTLQPGVVMTMEPGLYFYNTSIPELEGFGVRIEDDYLITESGAENLTSLAPK